MHIYIFIYIGYLFVKHDLALICVDTRRRKKQGKLEERERIKGHSSHTEESLHMNEHHRAHADTHTYTHTHTPWLLTATTGDGVYVCGRGRGASFGRMTDEFAVVR